MARTVRDSRLETRTARAALKPSGKPYYKSIDEGLHIGYRKSQAGGKWVMRRYAGKQAYVVETIGTADDTLDPDGAVILSFAQAQAEARKRFTEAKRVAVGLPAQAGPYTVRDAIRDYLTWLESERKSARDARWRAEGLIIPELGDKPVAKLTTAQIRDWRDNLAKKAPRLRTKKGDAQKFRAAEAEDPEQAERQRKATANRTLTILKAALNRAWHDRKVASDSEWRPVTAFKEADAARVRYLTLTECTRLINAAPEDFRKLVQAALQTGARFGELAAVTAADFNPDSGTLHIRKSKSGKDRHVVLTDEGIELFRALAAGRPSGDRLLLKAEGGRWLKSHQTRPMKDACQAAKIAPAANFHVLRHTWASHSVQAGMPLMVVARNLGHSDTRMVERHYGHLSDSFIAKAIREHAPRFGAKIEGNVVALEGRQ